MSIENCDRHGRYDTDVHHGCPRCNSEDLLAHIKRNCPERADEIDELFAALSHPAPDNEVRVPVETLRHVINALYRKDNVESHKFAAELEAML